MWHDLAQKYIFSKERVYIKLPLYKYHDKLLLSSPLALPMQATKILITPKTTHPGGNNLLSVIGKRILSSGDGGNSAFTPVSKRVKQTLTPQQNQQTTVSALPTQEIKLLGVIDLMTSKIPEKESDTDEDELNIWYVVNRGYLVPFNQEYQKTIEAAFLSKICDLEIKITSGSSCDEIVVCVNFPTNTIKLSSENVLKRIVRTVGTESFCNSHITNNRFNMDTPIIISYPAEWESQESSCELKTLSIDNPERIRIVKKLEESGIKSIANIQRIQNQHLWKRYYLEREFVKEKNGGIANEMELFHGTKSTPPVLIYNGEEGFDMRYSNLGCWGKGIYFTDSAAYSYKYCSVDTVLRQAQILMCRVIIGDEFSCPEGDRNLVTPPRKPQTPNYSSTDILDDAFSEPRVSFAVNFYDSVVGKQGNTTIRTVYNNSKAYPAYLITIQLL